MTTDESIPEIPRNQVNPPPHFVTELVDRYGVSFAEATTIVTGAWEYCRPYFGQSGPPIVDDELGRPGRPITPITDSTRLLEIAQSLGCGPILTNVGSINPEAIQRIKKPIDPAAAVMPAFENIPEAIKALPNWVVWRRYREADTGNMGKEFLQIDGGAASTTDSSTWNTFEACHEAYQRDSGFGNGVAFVLDGTVNNDGLCYVSVKFDNCFDHGGDPVKYNNCNADHLVDPAYERIESLGSYTEIDADNTGIQCLVLAKPGTVIKYDSPELGHSFEVHSGIFIFTDKPWDATAIRPAADEVAAIVREVQDAKKLNEHGKVATHLSEQIAASEAKWAEKIPEASDLIVAEMNQRYSAGTLKDKFRVARFGPHPKYPLQRHVEFLAKDDFLNSNINPPVEVPKLNRKGQADGTQRMPRGKYWFESSERSEFDDVTFKPRAPAIITSKHNGRIYKTINTYAGFAVEPDHVDSAAKCSLYLDHIHDNIAGDDGVVEKYILDWMASGVQHPDNPGRSSLSMRGAPRAGKGVLAVYYGRLFGRHFLHATNRDHIVGKFNAHQAEKCLIFVDEALYAEIAADAQILKTLITEKTKLMERKGIDVIEIDSYGRFIFATNEDHPLRIEADDGRYLPIYVKEHESFANETDLVVRAEKRKAYFTPLCEQMDNGGSEALLGFLLDRDIRHFNAEAIPDTAERKYQKLLSAPIWDQVIIGIAQEGFLPGATDSRPWIARAHREDTASGRYGLLDAMRARGGQKLSRLTDHKLADILKAWGFEPKSLGVSRGWEAPLLPELRAKILTKYPAVEFDARIEWGAPEDTNIYVLPPQEPDYWKAEAAERKAKEAREAQEAKDRRAVIRETVARQETSERAEVRDLAARQAAVAEAVEQACVAGEAAKRERAAKAETARLTAKKLNEALPDMDEMVAALRPKSNGGAEQ